MWWHPLQKIIFLSQFNILKKWEIMTKYSFKNIKLRFDKFSPKRIVGVVMVIQLIFLPTNISLFSIFFMSLISLYPRVVFYQFFSMCNRDWVLFVQTKTKHYKQKHKKKNVIAFKLHKNWLPLEWMQKHHKQHHASLCIHYHEQIVIDEYLMGGCAK